MSASADQKLDVDEKKEKTACSPPNEFDEAAIDTWIKSNKVAIVSKPTCPYCVRATKLFNGFVQDGTLDKEDLSIWEINRHKHMGKIQDYMRKLTGGRTVPRVFVGGKFIGGCDGTMNLHRQGKLKTLL